MTSFRTDLEVLLEIEGNVVPVLLQDFFVLCYNVRGVDSNSVEGVSQVLPE